MQGVPDAELQLDRLALLLGRCEVTRIKQVAATMIRIWSRDRKNLLTGSEPCRVRS